MIAQELVKVGSAYIGKDGEVRYVYSINRPGNGYCVQWDSMPRPPGINAVLKWCATQHSRTHGIMQMRKFQEWAVDLYAPPVQQSEPQDSAHAGGEAKA